MFFVALATDYDGTLARDGRVDAPTIEALQQVRRSGRKLILVTGRDLPDLQRVFPELDLFDLVVAENGALLFNPAKKEETLLAEPPSLLSSRGCRNLAFPRFRSAGPSSQLGSRTRRLSWRRSRSSPLSLTLSSTRGP